MMGFCMRCKAKKEMSQVKYVTMQNGKNAAQGFCPVCNTKIFKICKASEVGKE